jgi:Protein of unknown function (DUF3300)
MTDRKMARMGQRISLFAALTAALALSGCGSKSPPSSPPATIASSAPAPSDVASAPSAAPEPSGAAAAADAVAQTLAPTDTTWSPEALEELLAPVALYPDVVLGQVLVAATNPQEVLDAGNWVLQNQNLKEKALDQAAKDAGFTAPVRGLIQSPEVIDMMCSEMNWTTELGQAFVNDQAGVLDAVQRLRAQAKSAGNLKTSPQLKVDTEVKDSTQVITVAPASPTVVYVPQYDPVAAYAPAPAPVPATTTTTTGHSTGAMVATGVMAFTAGILVHNIFDNDDDYYHGGYYPSYYGPPRPYHPPYPYRPRYGNGYYPSNNYHRPPNYQHGFNNNTVVVNNNNNYFNRYDNKSGSNRSSRTVNSPITAANPRRTDLPALNAQAKQRPAQVSARDASKVQGTYAGASRDSNSGARSSARGTPQPKVQGTYAGAQPKGADTKARSVPTPPASKAAPAAKPATATRVANAAPAPAARTAASGDRGRDGGGARASPAPSPKATRTSAVSGVDRGGSDRAASQRGHQSMPQGPPASAKAGGNAKASGSAKAGGKRNK